MYIAHYKVKRPSAGRVVKIVDQYRVLVNNPEDPKHRSAPLKKSKRQSTLIRYAELTALDKLEWIQVKE